MTYKGEPLITVGGKKIVAFLESGEWTVPSGITNVDGVNVQRFCLFDKIGFELVKKGGLDGY